MASCFHRKKGMTNRKRASISSYGIVHHSNRRFCCVAAYSSDGYVANQAVHQIDQPLQVLPFEWIDGFLQEMDHRLRLIHLFDVIIPAFFDHANGSYRCPQWHTLILSPTPGGSVRIPTAILKTKRRLVIIQYYDPFFAKDLLPQRRMSRFSPAGGRET